MPATSCLYDITVRNLMSMRYARMPAAFCGGASLCGRRGMSNDHAPGAARRSFELMRETGTLRVVLPELADMPDGAWSVVLELLGRMDETRHDGPGEIRTGEILAILLLL